MHRKEVRNIKGDLWGWYSVVGSAAACQSEDTRKAAYIVGDRLYVRETWCVAPALNKIKPSKLGKDTTELPGGAQHATSLCFKQEYMEWDPWPGKTKWRPAMYMPRWASRIFLEVTEVRAERVQDITEEDAKAEGLDAFTHATEGYITATRRFSVLWEQLNGERGYGWDTNPWVFVYTFRKLSDEEVLNLSLKKT